MPRFPPFFPCYLLYPRACAVTSPGYYWRTTLLAARFAGASCPANFFCTGRVPTSAAEAPVACTQAYGGSEAGSLVSPLRSDKQDDCGMCVLCTAVRTCPTSYAAIPYTRCCCCCC